ncbi:hypothetical protein ACFWPQ_51345 [Streptomyces sp. NPDC058464]|uniref:hypothetical protein n=1 Tax=Streptomyces sp. NPDC058464 TaxID=3346511 RepID=UPI003668304E
MPPAVGFLVREGVSGLSWYGAGQALVSAAFGDGTRPAQGRPSLVCRALLMLPGVMECIHERPLRVLYRRSA